MLSHPEAIKRHFNKASKTYDTHSGLQQSIGENLIALISEQQRETHRIIDLGCGTGRVTEKLAHTFSYQTLHAIDIASELLKKTRERLPHCDVYEANFDQLSVAPHPFDLVFSNMALQWSTDLTHTLQSISHQLNPSGLIAFSIPLSGTLAELKHHYALNHFFSLETIKDKLTACELTLLAQKTEKITLRFDTLFAALKSIKHVGASYTGKQIKKGLRGKALLNVRMAQQLTYVIGYFIATRHA